MMQSYEAIYDHGQLRWIGDKPTVDEARVIVTMLGETAKQHVVVRHVPSARIAGKGKILGDIIAPAASEEDWGL